MVYKVIGDFRQGNFKDILTKIQRDFKFMYKNGCLYLAVLNWKDFKDKDNKELLEMIREIFEPRDEFLVKELNENNLNKEDRMIIDWVRDNYIRLDEERYDYQQQEKLRHTWKAMDIMEDILHKEYVERFNKEVNPNSDNTDKDSNDLDDFVF